MFSSSQVVQATKLRRFWKGAAKISCRYSFLRFRLNDVYEGCRKTSVCNLRENRKLVRSIYFCKDVVDKNDIVDFLDMRRRCGTSSDGDLKLLQTLLKEIMNYRTRTLGFSNNEDKVKKFCLLFSCLSTDCKYQLIQDLVAVYSVNHGDVYHAARAFLKVDCDNPLKIKKAEEQLKILLTPKYSWLFMQIGKLESGVKFLVDLRSNVLDLIVQKTSENCTVVELQKLNATLHELLSLWFSLGFLELERVTWKSSCELLQKISDYEAVHPMRNWMDLKTRVGPYRRCFVFLHSSMPGEPIVVLHTALCSEISNSIDGIVNCPAVSADERPMTKMLCEFQEDAKNIKAAVFYSISSTQKGLQGIELGNYLIKRVVCELQNEFSYITEFSSLSPIPSFRAWLLDRLRIAKKGVNDILSMNEIKQFEAHFQCSDVFQKLHQHIVKNSWIYDDGLAVLLEAPLMRLCARYLFLEKHRGHVLDNVANFHLKNGAVMWRLNWKADTSPRGLTNSCGIMVNYRYFITDTEINSINYIERHLICSSEQIIGLSNQAQKLILNK